jgi:hypothetical protein
MRSLKSWVLLALIAATAFVSQIALASLPNVELVTLWFLIIAQFITWKESLIVVFIFSILEALVWGFGDWVIAYLWIWSLWMILIQALKPLFKQNEQAWALLSALFGLSFGLLFSIQYALIYGLHMGIIYWVRGLLFDLIHATSNYILVILLYKPIYKVVLKLMGKWRINEHHK